MREAAAGTEFAYSPAEGVEQGLIFHLRINYTHRMQQINIQLVASFRVTPLGVV